VDGAHSATSTCHRVRRGLSYGPPFRLERVSGTSSIRRVVADTATDEEVRTLWVSMAHAWMKLAEAAERLQSHKGARMVTAQDKAKSQLEAPPTQCPRCKTLMKVRKCIPIPGRKLVDVDYRCDECGAEVLRAVPRER
jgi:alpha-ketoglutarate-dependent taurine dioxygenase